jgi:hypothetical protein
VDDYRVLAGLSPRHPLQSPARSAGQAALMRARIASDPRIGEGMADGARLARSGELQRRAQRAYRERPPALERQRQLSADGSRLGTGRALLFRARREARARALGFGDLTAYYRSRYLDQRLRLDQLAGELRCAERGARGPDPARARPRPHPLARGALASPGLTRRRQLSRHCSASMNDAERTAPSDPPGLNWTTNHRHAQLRLAELGDR